MTDLRQLAESLARGAGALAPAGRRAAAHPSGLGGTTKSTTTDMVTEFDRAAEAIDPCFVAVGRLDVYFEEHLNLWDAAAGELIAREAGAISTDFSGGPPRPTQLLVAASGLHVAFVDLLKNTR